MSPRPRLPYDLCDPVLARATWSRLAEPAAPLRPLLYALLGTRRGRAQPGARQPRAGLRA